MTLNFEDLNPAQVVLLKKQVEADGGNWRQESRMFKMLGVVMPPCQDLDDLLALGEKS